MDKGKAIAKEDNGGNISTARQSGHGRTREVIMNLPAPPPSPNNTSLAAGTSLPGQWMGGGMYLPPLARREFNNYGRNVNFGYWVRVYGPDTVLPPDFNNFGVEVTSAQWPGAMNLPTHHSNVNDSGWQINLPNNAQGGAAMTSVSHTMDITDHNSPAAPRVNANYNSGEGTSAKRAGGSTTSESTTDHHETPPTTCVSSLNPNAPEWKEVPIEDRSLFVTFSLGYPLTTKQVFWYLAQAFGIRNLHTVDINKPRSGPAHFGRLVFNTIMVPLEILKGKEEARLMIYGRSMFCKRYRPKIKDKKTLQPPDI